MQRVSLLILKAPSNMIPGIKKSPSLGNTLASFFSLFQDDRGMTAARGEFLLGMASLSDATDPASARLRSSPSASVGLLVPAIQPNYQCLLENKASLDLGPFFLSCSALTELWVSGSTWQDSKISCGASIPSASCWSLWKNSETSPSRPPWKHRMAATFLTPQDQQWPPSAWPWVTLLWGEYWLIGVSSSSNTLTKTPWPPKREGRSQTSFLWRLHTGFGFARGCLAARAALTSRHMDEGNRGPTQLQRVPSETHYCAFCCFPETHESKEAGWIISWPCQNGQQEPWTEITWERHIQTLALLHLEALPLYLLLPASISRVPSTLTKPP